MNKEAAAALKDTDEGVSGYAVEVWVTHWKWTQVVWEHVVGALNSVSGLRPRAQKMSLIDTFSVSRIP